MPRGSGSAFAVVYQAVRKPRTRTNRVVKTIDDYRDEYRRMREFHETNGRISISAISEMADIVLASLAVAEKPHLFTEADGAVQRMVLRDLRHYKRTGQRQLIHLHSGNYTDGRALAGAAITTLAAAGLVSQSMQCIAMPQPMFMGLELIRGVDPLRERLGCDDMLLDAELVALARQVPNPLVHAQCWTMSLLVTEHQRVDIDERIYRRVPVRSLLATFALRKSVALYFWPRFSFGSLSRFRVIRESGPRGQTALHVKLDLNGKGRLFCREMELLRIEEIGL